jgi:hypothetical protein
VADVLVQRDPDEILCDQLHPGLGLAASRCKVIRGCVAGAAERYADAVAAQRIGQAALVADDVQHDRGRDSHTVPGGRCGSEERHQCVEPPLCIGAP